MNITLYSKSKCANCEAARNVLRSKNLEFTDISLDNENRRNNFMTAYPDVKKLPQIFVGDRHIGGLTELYYFVQRIENE